MTCTMFKANVRNVKLFLVISLPIYYITILIVSIFLVIKGYIYLDIINQLSKNKFETIEVYFIKMTFWVLRSIIDIMFQSFLGD